MSKEIQTRCPHCQTVFRLGEAHLNAAKGQVRCGSCLEVFNALDHQIGEATANPPVATDITTPSPTEPQIDDSFGLFESNEEQPDSQEQTDESWAEAMLDELGPEISDANDTPPPLPPRKEQIELSDDLMHIGQDDQADAFGALDDERETVRTLDENAEEDWARELLNELEEEGPEAEPLTSNANKPISDDLAAEAAAELDFLEEEVPDDFFTDIDQITPGSDDTSNFAEQVIPEPDYPSEQPAQRPWIVWIGQTALIVLAGLLIYAQYIYFNFNDLARTAEWRPTLTSICQQIGCSLPTPSDPARIRSTNLIVRSHPDIPGALLVDTVIENQAPFPQPLPDIRLTFYTINDRPVAQRTFAPSQYLQGSLKNLKVLEENEPVHVSLAIADPGAPNYRLTFVKPNS